MYNCQYGFRGSGQPAAFACGEKISPLSKRYSSASKVRTAWFCVSYTEQQCCGRRNLTLRFNSRSQPAGNASSIARVAGLRRGMLRPARLTLLATGNCQINSRTVNFRDGCPGCTLPGLRGLRAARGEASGPPANAETKTINRTVKTYCTARKSRSPPAPCASPSLPPASRCETAYGSAQGQARSAS